MLEINFIHKHQENARYKTDGCEARRFDFKVEHASILILFSVSCSGEIDLNHLTFRQGVDTLLLLPKQSLQDSSLKLLIALRSFIHFPNKNDPLSGGHRDFHGGFTLTRTSFLSMTSFLQIYVSYCCIIAIKPHADIWNERIYLTMFL